MPGLVIPPVNITFVSPAKLAGADLAQARCVTDSFVSCKLGLEGQETFRSNISAIQTLMMD